MKFVQLKENFFTVKKRIENAVQKVGRKKEQITLVCISKQRTVLEIKQLKELGQIDFGENRLQELEQKAPQLNGVRWHFVGNLQSNKARKVVEICEFINSVDSLKLLTKINSAAKELEKVQKIFLEVNVSGEKTKHGFAPNQIAEVLEAVKKAKEK